MLSPSQIICSQHDILKLPLIDLNLNADTSTASFALSVGHVQGSFHPVYMAQIVDMLTSPLRVFRAIPVAIPPVCSRSIAWSLTNMISNESSKCRPACKPRSSGISAVALDVRIEKVDVEIPSIDPNNRKLDLSLESLIAVSSHPLEKGPEDCMPQQYSVSLQRTQLSLRPSASLSIHTSATIELLSISKIVLSIVRTADGIETSRQDAHPDKAWDWSTLGVGGGSSWIEGDTADSRAATAMWRVKLGIPAIETSINVDDALEALWLLGAKPSSPQVCTSFISVP